MSLSRSDIRKKLLAGGRFDLSKEEDVHRLDREVRGHEIWLRSDLARELDGDGLRLTPRELLGPLKWGNRNVPKKNEKDVLKALLLRRTVSFRGTMALRAAVAFSKQITIQKAWHPYYIDASNLITQKFETGLSESPRSILVIDNSYQVEDGRIFVEQHTKIVSLLKDHSGATILMSPRQQMMGPLEKLINQVKSPTLTLGVGKGGTDG